MSFGENIKKQRLALGMTLEEVADKVGVTRQTMSRYETGKINNYSPETISKIAEALDTTGACLLGYDESDTSTEIGERIKALRLKNGLTLDEVATALGTIRQTIYKYEHGIISNIPAENIVKLAKLFKVSSDYILGLSEKAQSSCLQKYDESIDAEREEKTDAQRDSISIKPEFARKVPQISDEQKRIIGYRIKAERKAIGYTQADLLKAMGLSTESRQTVTYWESGKRLPSLEDFLKMREIFNCELGYLLCEEGCEVKTSVASLKAERGTLIGELKTLRKAVDEINNILDSLGVRE